MLYAAVTGNSRRFVTFPDVRLIRYSVERESSAQIEPRPDATAIAGPRRRSDFRVLPLLVSTRITRDCSLHATHAELPSKVSVIVGQSGPAAAQTLSTR